MPMEEGDRVEPRGHRVFEVVFQVAGAGDIGHEEHAARLECVVDVGEHLAGLGLVVDRIEGRDEVEPSCDIEPGYVGLLEPRVGEAPVDGFALAPGDTLVGEVVTGEPTPRERACHDVDGVSAATADVGDIDAGFEPFDEARYDGEDGGDERVIEDLARVGGHDFLEAREPGVLDAAAVPERTDDIGFDVGHECDERCVASKVVRTRRAGGECRMLRREAVGLVDGAVLNDSAGDHGGEPFAHIAFLEPRAPGDIGAGGP